MTKPFIGSIALLILAAGLAEAQPGYPPPWGPPPVPQWGPPPPPWGAPPGYLAPYPQYDYPQQQPMYNTPVFQPYPVYPPMPQVQQPSPPPAPTTAEPPVAAPLPRNDVAPPAPRNDAPPPRNDAAPAPHGDAPPPPPTGESSLASELGHGSFHPEVIREECVPGRRFWMTPEALYWFAKPGPLPVPIVTTGNVADPIPGGIGQPGTTVLFGGNGINYPWAAGFRATFGMWIDSEEKWGAEVSGFILENAVQHYSVASNAAGSPFLAVPFVNVTSAGSKNGILPLSVPNFGGSTLIGGASVTSASQLYGGEANGLYNLLRSRGFEVDFLGGFRYLNLQESFGFNANRGQMDGNFSASETFNDSFQTTNQFYGGQVGVRASYQYQSFFASATLKAALGVNMEGSNVNGSTVFNSNGLITASPGGIFTQSSNIGKQYQNPFSAVPQLTARVGWEAVPGIRLFAGYDFMYWFNTVRPGTQIDPNINMSQSLGGALSGPGVPAKMFNQSNYYVQGFSVGIEFRY